MNDQSDSITITTECIRGRSQLRVLRFVFWGIASGLLCVIPLVWTIPFGDAPNDTRFDVTWLLVICSISAIVPPLVVPRGTWTFTDRHVCFVSHAGEERALPWDEIEQVQWQQMAAAFRAGKTKIQIGWNMHDDEDVSKAKRFIEDKLSLLFDLSPYVRPRLYGPSVWSVVLWAAKMFAISLPLTAIAISGPLLAAVWFPNAGWAWAIGMLLLFSPWLLIIPVAMQERRKYPFWRKRRNDRL